MRKLCCGIKAYSLNLVVAAQDGHLDLLGSGGSTRSQADLTALTCENEGLVHRVTSFHGRILPIGFRSKQGIEEEMSESFEPEVEAGEEAMVADHREVVSQSRPHEEQYPDE